MRVKVKNTELQKELKGKYPLCYKPLIEWKNYKNNLQKN